MTIPTDSDWRLARIIAGEGAHPAEVERIALRIAAARESDPDDGSARLREAGVLVRVLMHAGGRTRPAPPVAKTLQLAAITLWGLGKAARRPDVWTPDRVAAIALRAAGQPAEDAELVQRLRVVGGRTQVWDLILTPWNREPMQQGAAAP